VGRIAKRITLSEAVEAPQNGDKVQGYTNYRAIEKAGLITLPVSHISTNARLFHI
jgi:hypothetical protein